MSTLAQADFPDPLKTADGRAITTAEEWNAIRKPELKALFQEHVYGKLPAAPPSVTGKVLFEDRNAFDGSGILTEIELQFDAFGKSNALPIRLLLAVPKNAGKVPVFVGINFYGNHVLTADERVGIPGYWMYDKKEAMVEKNRATPAGRGKLGDAYPLALILKRGYAVATFCSGDIQPDRAGVSEGFRALVPPTETGTIMGWAWGLHRAVDYLVQRPELDAKRIAVVGHSRLGKTALLAAAYDERIAVAIPNQAGCGGTGPSRHADPKAETVKRITTAFPHWFAPKFSEYGADPEKCPVDQHLLLALCAPRPVFYPNAEKDVWANPAGQFDMLKRATPVYKLLGVEGLTAAAMPQPGDAPTLSRLGYWLRPGLHSMTPADWEQYLAFTDRWMK
jgi:hypothetical protein